VPAGRGSLRGGSASTSPADDGFACPEALDVAPDAPPPRRPPGGPELTRRGLALEELARSSFWATCEAVTAARRDWSDTASVPPRANTLATVRACASRNAWLSPGSWSAARRIDARRDAAYAPPTRRWTKPVLVASMAATGDQPSVDASKSATTAAVPTAVAPAGRSPFGPLPAASRRRRPRRRSCPRRPPPARYQIDQGRSARWRARPDASAIGSATAGSVPLPRPGAGEPPQPPARGPRCRRPGPLHRETERAVERAARIGPTDWHVAVHQRQLEPANS
jgi:hypothetical protein